MSNPYSSVLNQIEFPDERMENSDKMTTDLSKGFHDVKVSDVDGSRITSKPLLIF